MQQPEFVDPLNQTAMACPAFPLCPLAITEAERGIPSILKRVRAMFEKVRSLCAELQITYTYLILCHYRHLILMCKPLFLDQVGLEYDESVVIRVTGCPNGCARPYMAELGLVGDGPNSYQVRLEHKLFLLVRQCS